MHELRDIIEALRLIHTDESVSALYNVLYGPDGRLTDIQRYARYDALKALLEIGTVRALHIVEMALRELPSDSIAFATGRDLIERALLRHQMQIEMVQI